jgi:hypothetical protein
MVLGAQDLPQIIIVEHAPLLRIRGGGPLLVPNIRRELRGAGARILLGLLPLIKLLCDLLDGRLDEVGRRGSGGG